MTDAPNHPLWLWLNLLSLDAPIVALVWQDFLSRCFAAPLFTPGRLILGLTVWAIYIADRLLDVRKPSAGTGTPRHRFYRANRNLATVLLAMIAGADLLTLASWLRPAVFHNGLVVAAAASAYLLLFTATEGRWAFFKKSSAAVLFTAGVFLVAWTGTTTPATLLLWPAIAFALLCKANLVLIEHWERHWPTRPVWVALAFFALICVAAGNSRWYYAIALSSAVLMALGICGGRLSGDARRVLADAALLTPLLLQ